MAGRRHLRGQEDTQPVAITRKRPPDGVGAAGTRALRAPPQPAPPQQVVQPPQKRARGIEEPSETASASAFPDDKDQEAGSVCFTDDEGEEEEEENGDNSKLDSEDQAPSALGMDGSDAEDDWDLRDENTPAKAEAEALAARPLIAKKGPRKTAAAAAAADSAIVLICMVCLGKSNEEAARSSKPRIPALRQYVPTALVKCRCGWCSLSTSLLSD